MKRKRLLQQCKYCKRVRNLPIIYDERQFVLSFHRGVKENHRPSCINFNRNAAAPSSSLLNACNLLLRYFMDDLMVASDLL